MNVLEKSLQKHYEWKGKIETRSKALLDSKEALSLAYTPGVAKACLEIKDQPDLSFELTGRGNYVAVITDGTAILGLGDIGPLAGMPVMEGKCALFKEFGNVDAVPLCIDSKDPEDIIKTIKLIAPSFGGINLEDISAPRCFEIETRLKEELNIPVFHDDQHGTAIVVGAALITALKLAKKRFEDIFVVINGAGAAGISIAKFLLKMGVKNIVACDRQGILCDGDLTLNEAQKALCKVTNKQRLKGSLSDAMKGADVFIGVSGPNLVTKEMIKTMAKDPIVFPLANPVPEISYQDAKDAGAFIVGTGSSQNPNQINNALVFPGLFRGALDAKATTVTYDMMLAASFGLSEAIKDTYNKDYILPDVFDKKAHENVAKKVYECAKMNGVCR